MTKKRNYNVFVYLCMAVTIFLMGNNADGQLSFGSYIGALYTCNIWVVSLFYLASCLLRGVNGLINGGIQVAVMVVVLLISRKAKKPINSKVLTLAMIVANIYYLVVNYSVESLLSNIGCVVGGIVSAFVFIYSFRSLFVRTLAYKPALDEVVCLGLFYFLCCYCLSMLSIGVFMPICFVAPLAIMLISSLLGNNYALVCGSLTSLATLLATGLYSLMPVYIAMAVVAVAFCRYNRYLMAMLLVVVDILLAYFTDSYGSLDIYALLPTIGAVALYMLIPTKTLRFYRDKLTVDGKYASKAVVNRIRSNLASKLYRLSDIYLTIRNNFVALASSNIDAESTIASLADSVSNNVCADCSNRKMCWRSNIKEMEETVMALCRCAVDKGSATVLDVTPMLASTCRKLPALLSYINEKVGSYTNQLKATQASSSSKMLLGEQLGGVSQLLGKLAQDCRGKLSFDSDKERQIIESLTFHNIMTSQAIYVEHNSSVNLILTVATKDLDNGAICSVVSSIVNYQMYVERVENSSACWATVYLAVEPQYSLNFGLRTTPKYGSEVSGDAHSFIDIGEGKHLIAICDGMGSGNSAESMSNLSISLIENLYRAGLDNDLILSCVNRLMTSYQTESYSTADVCVVDLYNGLCDFIKLGASKGLVKSGEQVTFIASQSLPLGVVAPIKPVVTKKTLGSGDLVILASDGVWDSFEQENYLADIVARSTSTNAQIIADTIMDSALLKCKGRAIDDMTVLVARMA